MSEEAAELHRLLAGVALRLGIASALRSVTRAAAVASLLGLIWAVAGATVPIPLPPRAVGAWLAVALALSFPVLVWLHRPALLRTARVTDRRLGLGDRLSTAVELVARPEAPLRLARLQVLDALEEARRLAVQSAAPVRVPQETWIAVAASGVLFLWAHFLLGWAIPGLPAARTAAVIHGEGRTLAALGQRLETSGRARGLPEIRRAADLLQDLGRRLQSPRMSRQQALGLLGEVGRRLGSAQDMVERRLEGADLRSSARPSESRSPQASPAEADRVEGALRELESISQQLREGGSPGGRDHLARRLMALTATLDQMRIPASSRQGLAAARQEIERGRLSVAASALRDVMQDLRSMERMLGDEQGLGAAREQVQRSAERIGAGGFLGSAPRPAQGSDSAPAPPTAFPGPNPPTAGADERMVPPPGPNQGSLAGQGPGGAPGLTTPRLDGLRVEQHLQGRPGNGPAIVKDLLAPGRRSVPRLPAVAPPADVAHANDRALASGRLPPAYVTVIRRYFEALGETR